MILLHYPPLAWYHVVYGDALDDLAREVEWTPEPGSPSIGLFQFLPSTWDTAKDLAEDFRQIRIESPKRWGKTAALADLRESFLNAGTAAARATSSFEDLTATRARHIARERLHREASAALARGDRKAHRRALSELRDIERKH